MPWLLDSAWPVWSRIVYLHKSEIATRVLNDQWVGFEKPPNWYIEFVAGNRTVREATKFTKRSDAAEVLKKRISESTSRYS